MYGATQTTKLHLTFKPKTTCFTIKTREYGPVSPPPRMSLYFTTPPRSEGKGPQGPLRSGPPLGLNDPSSPGRPAMMIERGMISDEGRSRSGKKKKELTGGEHEAGGGALRLQGTYVGNYLRPRHGAGSGGDGRNGSLTRATRHAPRGFGG